MVTDFPRRFIQSADGHQRRINVIRLHIRVLIPSLTKERARIGNKRARTFPVETY